MMGIASVTTILVLPLAFALPVLRKNLVWPVCLSSVFW